MKIMNFDVTKLTSFAALSLMLSLGACGNTSDAAPLELSPIEKAEFAALPVLSGDHIWIVDQAKSELSFSGTHNQDIFSGKIPRFKTSIKLNPDDPSEAEIHAIMSLAGIDLGDDDRTANLPTQNWFDISAYPVAKFRSKTIRKIADNQFQAEGELTLKGISKPITLLFDLKQVNNGVIATGQARLIRTDFNVGQGADFADESWVSFPVTVNMTLYARLAAP